MKRTVSLGIAALVVATAAGAQNLAPELMIEGSCDELAAWAARPADQIRADLDAMLGTTSGFRMSDSMYATMMGVLENTPVSASWFARPCTFSDAELAAMEPLREAYVAHMADKLAPE